MYLCFIFFQYKNTKLLKTFKFQDKPTLSSYSVSCKADQTYNEPNVWPTCVDKLDCAEPVIDSTVMVYDWTEDIGITPPFEIK